MDKKNEQSTSATDVKSPSPKAKVDKTEKHTIIFMIITILLVIGLIVATLRVHKLNMNVSELEFQVCSLAEENNDIRDANDQLRTALNADHLTAIQYDSMMLASDILYIDSVLDTHYANVFVSPDTDVSKVTAKELAATLKEDKVLQTKAINIIKIYLSNDQIFIEDKPTPTAN